MLIKSLPLLLLLTQVSEFMIWENICLAAYKF